MTLPTTSPRIFAIDSLRGFALAGVALVHMVEQYIAGPPPKGFIDMESFMWVDYLAMGITGIFIQGKFFALFSILFGLSFSLQMDNAAKISSGSLPNLWIFSLGVMDRKNGNSAAIKRDREPFFSYGVPNGTILLE